MSGAVICAAISITIGKECLIGADVLIADSDFHSIKPEGRRYGAAADDIGAAPVVIEDNVFIGARTVVLKGVRIGRDSVIGAGSVVACDIPEGAVAVGNPARVIRNV
jgi:acetyltransferase-like isoleucine patch superfamily enzyme